MPNDNNTQQTGLKFLLRALRNKNYRIFFCGQGLSLIGTWMQFVAINWLVYKLTNSPFYLGAVSFANQISSFIIAPLGGVIADRFDKRKIVFATQFFSMLQALILTVLFFTGNIQIWHILTMSIFIGIVNGFDIPTRQAFINELVENRDDLPNAIALNSMIFNGARLAGPSIAGIIIALAGEGTCFAINAASFIAVLIALFFIKTKSQISPPASSAVSGFKEGLIYAWHFKPIRYMLLLLSFVSLVAFPYSIMMPVFARDILKGSSDTLGFLVGAIGLGAFLGAIYLASRKSVHKLANMIVVALATFSVAIFAFSLSQILWLSFIFITFAGFGVMIQMAAVNTLLQTIVDDNKRGRIMSLYTMAFIGMSPFGSFIAGYLASKIGAPHTIQIGASLCLLATFLFASKLKKIHQTILPIYEKPKIPTQPPAIT